MALCRKNLRPCDIKFTQDSIGSRFTNGKFVSDTFHQLLNGRISVYDIPSIEVVADDGDWWALTGNRRLYIYRILETLRVIETIPVDVMSVYDYGVQRRFSERKTTICGGRTIEMRQFQAERHINQSIEEWQKTRGCTYRNQISANEALLRNTSKGLSEYENKTGLEKTQSVIQMIENWQKSKNHYSPIPLDVQEEIGSINGISQNHNCNGNLREPSDSSRNQTLAVDYNESDAEERGIAVDNCEVEMPDSNSDDLVITNQPRRLNIQEHHFNQNSDDCCAHDCCWCCSCC